MKILKVREENPNTIFINTAVDAIKKGDIIIIPTDGVYALACNALDNKAVEKICSVKKIKSAKNSLSIICKDIAQAAEYARINNEAFSLMKRNLPGPFTFILPACNRLPKAFKERKEVGIRIPSCNIPILLTELLGNPIMVSSVPECSDIDRMTEPEFIAEDFNGRAEIILDAGRSSFDHSTIINCIDDEFEIIRQGKGELQ